MPGGGDSRIAGWNGGLVLEDRTQEIYDQYELKIYNTYRARGAVILETEEGLKLCRTFTGSEKRLEFEDCVKQHLNRTEYRNVDGFVRNREGNLISVDSLGEKYVIRDWFGGEECSLKKREKACGAASNLAWLHENLKGVEIPSELMENGSMRSQEEIFARRNRELKRVKTYMKEKRQKNLFETQYLKIWDTFYQEACAAMEQFAESECRVLWEEAAEEKLICHGNYNYHNILILKREEYGWAGRLTAAELAGTAEYATTNFEKAVYGPQVTDLYQFLRKAMEKNEWDTEYGMALIEEYDRIRPLRKIELRLLYILLLYPEKFWKITNCYYNSKKTWIPQKNIEKLLALRDQMKAKELFLKELDKIIQTNV